MEPEAQATETKIVNVPITKGKTTLPVDINAISDEVFAEIVLQGLKVLLNRGASKVTKEAYPKAEEMQAKAVKTAQAQLDLVNTGKIKFTGGKKKSGTTGAVMTEARRLAKAFVKDELKRAGIKISHVEASDITKAANLYLDTDGGAKLIEQAKVNLADREKISISDDIDVTKIIHVSEKLVAKSEARKAEAKAGTLSKTQAGKVKVKVKPQSAGAMH